MGGGSRRRVNAASLEKRCVSANRSPAAAAGLPIGRGGDGEVAGFVRDSPDISASSWEINQRLDPEVTAQ